MEQLQGQSSPDSGAAGARGRTRRRLVLVGPLAMWAASVPRLVAGAAHKPKDGNGPESSRSAGREGTTITPAVNAKIVREISFDRPGRVADHMAWSPDGERIAVGGALDLQMSVLDVRTGRPLPAPGEQLAGVRGLAYSPDGRYLAVIRSGTGRKNAPAVGRYTVSLWDARTSVRTADIVEPESGGVDNIQAHALSFSSDGRFLAVAYLKQTAIYDLTADGQPQRILLLPPASRCAFRPETHVLACLSLGLGLRTLGLYRVPEGEMAMRIELQATNLGWSPTGHLMATTGGGRVDVRDVTSLQEVRTLTVPDPDARFQSVSSSFDGRWFVAASDRRVDIWETATWTHMRTLGHRRKFVAAASFAPRESLLGVVGYAPVTLWSVNAR